MHCHIKLMDFLVTVDRPLHDPSSPTPRSDQSSRGGSIRRLPSTEGVQPTLSRATVWR